MFGGICGIVNYLVVIYHITYSQRFKMNDYDYQMKGVTTYKMFPSGNINLIDIIPKEGTMK